jgi:hypothetical protein
VRIESLKRYQRPRGQTSFANLSPSQRATAEVHYQRLCARWGDDLPPWRRAILAGRATDLALRPRNGAWARRLRAGHKPHADTRALNTVTTTCVESTAATTDPGRVNPYYRGYRDNALSAFDEPSASSTAESVLRLDVHGVTRSGTDGADTAQRILQAMSQAFDNSPHFSLAVPEKDLPKQWAWRLLVVAVS